MMIIGHTAIGVGVGLLTGNPLLALPVGILSHHIADAIPHFDAGSFLTDQPREVRDTAQMTQRDWAFIVVDVLATLGVLAYLYSYFNQSELLAVGAGVIGANLPDVVHNVPFWSKQVRKISWIRVWQERVHWVYHWTIPARVWYFGLATQLIPLVLVIWWVVNR